MTDDKITLVITSRMLDHIQDALVQYIDYLRDGDKDDKWRAKRVEKTYNELFKQIKWSEA